MTTIEAYRLIAEKVDYPLHLGVTEAGGFTESAVKSSAALGTLLHEGIGDTIRVSVSAPPEDELIIGKQLLKCFNLIEGVPDLISCPTCGRTARKIEPLGNVHIFVLIYGLIAAGCGILLLCFLLLFHLLSLHLLLKFFQIPYFAYLK